MAVLTDLLRCHGLQSGCYNKSAVYVLLMYTIFFFSVPCLFKCNRPGHTVIATTIKSSLIPIAPLLRFYPKHADPSRGESFVPQHMTNSALLGAKRRYYRSVMRRRGSNGRSDRNNMAGASVC